MHKNPAPVGKFNMTTLAYEYRINGSKHTNWLSAIAKKVNCRWNAAQDFSLREAKGNIQATLALGSRSSSG